MIGYWIVVAMIGCALAAVVVAGATEAEAVPSSDVRDRQIRRRTVVAILTAPAAPSIGAAEVGRETWVSRLAGGLAPGVVVHHETVGGRTLAEARRDRLPAVLVAEPIVVGVWMVLDDLATGVPLRDYERELAATLTTLTAAGCRVALGNVPDLGRAPGLDGGSDHAVVLRLTAEHWNAAIGRLAATYGAEVVDLFDEPGVVGESGSDGFRPSPGGNARLVARFRPAIRRALAAAERRPARVASER